MRFLLIVFMFLPGFLAAQDTSAWRTNVFNDLEPIFADTCPIYSEPVPILKASLVSPFQKYHTAKIGFEFPVYKSIAGQATAGYIFDYDKNTYKLDYTKGSYEFGADAKYYFPLITVIRLYTGPMVVYRQLNAQEGVFVTQTTTDANGNLVTTRVLNMQNAAIVREEELSYLWQAGVQPLLTNHIALDIFIAMGTTKQKKTSRQPGDENQLVTKKWAPATVIGAHLGFVF
ncbi:MAG: hypothetical protein ACXWEY_09470 [Bacteroidia bacterium]